MTETQQIENYLAGTLTNEDHLLMDAKCLIDAGFREKVKWQRNAHALIKAYARKQLKKEIEQVHNRLFTEKRFENFRNSILTIFK